jgi:hypothetical protein
MAARKGPPPVPPKLVRKSVLVDADKLARARKHLGADSDAEVLRLALEHLLGHFEGFPLEEE